MNFRKELRETDAKHKTSIPFRQKAVWAQPIGGVSSFCQVFFGYFLWRQKVTKKILNAQKIVHWLNLKWIKHRTAANTAYK